MKLSKAFRIVEELAEHADDREVQALATVLFRGVALSSAGRRAAPGADHDDSCCSAPRRHYRDWDDCGCD